MTLKVDQSLFELKPRWPNAPLICLATNLPAFFSRGELSAFHAANGGTVILTQWECNRCGRYHYLNMPHTKNEYQPSEALLKIVTETRKLN